MLILNVNTLFIIGISNKLASFIFTFLHYIYSRDNPDNGIKLLHWLGLVDTM